MKWMDRVGWWHVDGGGGGIDGVLSAFEQCGIRAQRMT